MCPKKWSERVEEEFEGLKDYEDYEIEVMDIGEDNIIHNLVLTRWHGYSAERFEIEYWGNKLRVSWKYKPNAFSAFKTRAEFTCKDSFEEDPWWVNPDELEKTIADMGVYKSYWMILDYIHTLFSEPFEERI